MLFLTSGNHNCIITDSKLWFFGHSVGQSEHILGRGGVSRNAKVLWYNDSKVVGKRKIIMI